MPNIKEVPQAIGRVVEKVVFEKRTDLRGGLMTPSGFIREGYHGVPGALLLKMGERRPGYRDALFEVTQRRVRGLKGAWREVSRSEITT